MDNEQFWKRAYLVALEKDIPMPDFVAAKAVRAWNDWLDDTGEFDPMAVENKETE